MPPPQLLPATPEQSLILANLLELYAHDFSEFVPLDIGDDGRFGYPPLPLYWSDPTRHPFLVKLNSQYAGFVLVKQGSEVSGDPAVWDMTEFFILRGYRQKGIGTQVAHQVWQRFPGPWEVRVMQANASALPFWTAAIATFTGEAIHPARVEKGPKRWSVFSFHSKPLN